MRTSKLRDAALALAITFACVSQANAAPASRASLESLFQLLHADAMIDSVYDTMEKSTAQIVAHDAGKRSESLARQQIEAKASADVMALVRSEYNWKVMEPEMIDAYQKTFTEEEITAMINFYATPAGQAAITKLPHLMQSLMASTQAHIQTLMPRIRAISEKASADADAADAAH